MKRTRRRIVKAGIAALIGLILNRTPSQMLSGAPQVRRQSDAARDQRERPEVLFVSFVLDDVQKTCDKLLPAQTGVPYHHAKLVLYRNSFPSACGRASVSTGPFYCPGDEKVYLDLGFFEELKRKLGAPGEFARFLGPTTWLIPHVATRPLQTREM